MKNKISIILFVLILVTSFSCQHTQPPERKKLKLPASKMETDVQEEAPSPMHKESEVAAGLKPEKGYVPVTPLQTELAGKQGGFLTQNRFSKKKMVSVAVDNMPIKDFIHYIFSDILMANYVVDNKVAQNESPVTLNLKSDVSEYQLFDMSKNLLSQHQVSIIEKEGIYYCLSSTGVKDSDIGIGNRISDVPDTTGEIYQLVPVRYMDIQEIYAFLPQSVKVKALLSTTENLFVVSGSRDQIIQVLKTLKILDRPAMKGRHVGIINLKYWDPVEMQKKLTEVLQREGIPVALGIKNRGVYLNALERRGSILCFAAEEIWLERTRYWVSMLDIPEKGDRRYYYTYFPENCKAEELAESLQNILGVSEARKIEKKDTKKDSDDSSSSMVSFSKGGMKITADENRNVLIIHSTPEEYKELSSLLKRIDIMSVQVLLEATLAEVTLTDSLKYGVEWALKNTDGDQTSELKTLGGLGLGSTGLNYSFVSDSEKIQMLINAYAKDDLIKVISSPRLTVRDGKTASIVVGTEVPTLTSQASTPDISEGGTSGIISSIQYRTTGVSLSVTPTVHAKNVVALEISQTLSEAQSNDTSDIDSPMILNREITTEVVASDGQTIVIGGLIKENHSETETKVPFFGDIPIIGHLFRTQSNGGNSTELVLMITPIIIRNTHQIDELRDAIFNSMNFVSTESE